MSDTQKKPTEPAKRPPAAEGTAPKKAPVPPHKKIYGAESDIIDSVVRNVKRDSAQRNMPGGNTIADEEPPEKKTTQAKKATQRRASSDKNFKPSFGSNLGKSWRSFMAATKHIRYASVIIIALILVISAVFLDGQTIDVLEHDLTIYGLAEDLQGLRILHISDMNSADYGEEQAQLMRKISALSYDIVVMTGDMVGSGDDATQLYELLDAIPSSKEVYIIPGDSDPGPFVEVARDLNGTLNQVVLEEWILGAMDRGAFYVDRPISQQIGNAKLWFTPVDMLNTNLTETRGMYRDLEQQQVDGVLSGIVVDYERYPFTSYEKIRYEESYKSAASMKDQELHIALSHVPPSDEYIAAMETGIFTENIEDVQISRPDLILSGHYCNGVWNLPGIGAFYAANDDLPLNGWFPKDELISGMRVVNDTPLHISGGLSTNSSTPLMFTRLLNHPQMSIITLNSEMPESMLGD